MSYASSQQTEFLRLINIYRHPHPAPKGLNFFAIRIIDIIFKKVGWLCEFPVWAVCSFQSYFQLS